MNSTANKNFNECIDCKICTKECLLLKEHSLSPKELLKSLAENTLDNNTAFSCTLCNHCEKVCPKEINFGNLFLKNRQEQQLKKKTFNGVDIHQFLSFSKAFTNEPTSPIVFFPGCSLMAEKPESTLAAFNHLKNHIPYLEIMIKCCANPTHSIGKKHEFNKKLQDIQKSFEKNAVKEVIVGCINCYNILKKLKNVKVTSLWSVLDKYPVENINPRSTIYALHDPCPSRYEAHIHDAIRNILKNNKIEYMEFKNFRENTLCCGVGGMCGVFNPKLALDSINKRVSETDCHNIITYCAECTNSFNRTEKKAYHILDILFHKKSNMDNTLLKKWKNRYIFKQKTKP